MNKKQYNFCIHFSRTLWPICLIFVSIGSVLPGTCQILPFFGPDKLLHLIAYAGLAFLPPFFLKEKRLVFRCALFLILWGILMEGAQAMVPNRSPSFWDFVANTTGVALGTWVGMQAGSRLHRTRHS